MIGSQTAARSILSSFPSSYFTGPLGQFNVVPNAPNGVLSILWSDTRTTTAQRITDCGAFDAIGIHYGGIDSEIPGRGGGHLGAGGEEWVHEQGAVPIVSWVHNRFTKGTTNLNTMDEINTGLHDAIITEAADYWQTLDFRVIWRPFWEFDGNWFPWSPTSTGAGNANDGFPNPGISAALWKTAWQRVVGLVQTAGASKVGFFWCPTEGFSRTDATNCYPGDAYVDWVGSDGYNQADDTTGSGHPVQTSPLHTGWAEFWEIYNYTGHGSAFVCKHDEFGGAKPFVVGETNSLYDSNTASRKATWYRNVNNHANAKPDMPNLRGVQFFDQDLHANPSEGFDWRVDSNQTYTQKLAATAGSIDSATYQGFKDLVAYPAWGVGVVSKEIYVQPPFDLSNTFESGQADGTTISTGNSGGGAGSAFNAVQSTPQYSTTHAYAGTLGMKIDTTATYTEKHVDWTGLGSLTASVWFRAFVYFTAYPVTNNLRIMTARTSTPGNSALLLLNSSGLLQSQNAAQSGIGSFTTAVALNQWVRIEWRVRSSTTVGQTEIWLYNTPSAAIGSHDSTVSTTNSVLGANTDGIRFGASVGSGPNSCIFWMDNVAVSKSGPVGP